MGNAAADTVILFFSTGGLAGVVLCASWVIYWRAFIFQICGARLQLEIGLAEGPFGFKVEIDRGRLMWFGSSPYMLEEMEWHAG